MRVPKQIKIFLLICGLIGFTTLSAPWGRQYYRKANTKSSQPCWARLSHIEGAKTQWVLSHSATHGMTVTARELQPYLSQGQIPTCHIAGAAITIGKVGESVRCSVHGTVEDFKPDTY